MNGPTKTQIAEHWATRPDVFSINMDQPSCFACAWWKDGWAERTQPWEAARLQRCHLTPASLGGRATVENLVLLCAECHREAPDHVNGEWMIGWVQDREEWIWRRLREFETEIRASLMRAGASVDDYTRYLDDSKFAERVVRECAAPSGVISMSTAAAVLAQHHLAVTAKPVQLELFAA
jgi:HNH endonuclease